MRNLALLALMYTSFLTGAVDARETREDRETRAIEPSMNKKFDVRWSQLELSQAFDELRAVSGITLIVLPALGEGLESPVTLTLHGAPMRTILKVLEDLAGIDFLTKGGVLYATTVEDSIKRLSVLRVHDIRAALIRPPNFKPPGKLGLGRPRGDHQKIEEAPSNPIEPDDVVDLIMKGTGAKNWDIEGVSIRVIRGRLVVRHTPEVQEKISRLILSLGVL